MTPQHNRMVNFIMELIDNNRPTLIRVMENYNKSIEDFTVSYKRDPVTKLPTSPVINFEFKEFIDKSGITRLGMFKLDKNSTRHVIIPDCNLSSVASPIKKKKNKKTDPDKILLKLQFSDSVFYVDGSHRYTGVA